MSIEPMDPSSSGRDRRLEKVLVECVEAMERGLPIHRDELLARYPELAAEVAEFLAGRARIEQLAQPLRPPAPQAPPHARRRKDRRKMHQPPRPPHRVVRALRGQRCVR